MSCREERSGLPSSCCSCGASRFQSSLLLFLRREMRELGDLGRHGLAALSRGGPLADTESPFRVAFNGLCVYLVGHRAPAGKYLALAGNWREIIHTTCLACTILMHITQMDLVPTMVFPSIPICSTRKRFQTMERTLYSNMFRQPAGRGVRVVCV